jgi:predicted metalloprotease with PDZ domain
MRRFVLAAILLGSAAPLAAQTPTGRLSQPVAPTPLPPPVPEAQDIPFPGTILLNVDTTGSPQRGIWHVTETIPVAATGRMTLRYPRFLPGNHGPSGPIEAVAGINFKANGRLLTWARDPVDVFAFHVDVPTGTTQIVAEFDYLSDQPGSIGRTEHTANLINVEWEKVSLYPAGYYTRRIPVRATITLPDGFTGVSAVDGEPHQGGRIAYPQTDYETLVDSPLLAGRNFRAWDLGHDVDLNVFADRPEQLAATPEQIEAHRRLVEQAVRLFGSRRFDRYDLLLGLSSELSGIGLEHHRSSENVSTPRYFTDWEGTAAGRTLLPHEFEHSWNGKYRRPADLWAPDYNRPTRNSLLWVYEGQTPYWATILGARSGLTSPELALGEIASNAASFANQEGRRWRSLEDTTNQQIVMQRRRPSYPSWQRGTDYYDEAALIWLEADMRIRQLSHGQKSLDDFAQTFFAGRDGDWGTSLYTFEDVVAALNRVQPYDWTTFLRTRVYQPDANPPIGGIALGGYRLVWREAPNAYEASAYGSAADQRYSIGLLAAPDGRVIMSEWDSPAFREGIRPGANIMSVGGQPFTPALLASAITANKNGSAPIRLHVRDAGEERDVTLTYRGGLRYPHLERVGTGPAPLDAALAPRSR